MEVMLFWDESVLPTSVCKKNNWGYDNCVQMFSEHNIISIHKSNNFNGIRQS